MLAAISIAGVNVNPDLKVSGKIRKNNSPGITSQNIEYDISITFCGSRLS